MKSLLTGFTILTALIRLSCSSPLSDTNVTDPSLLDPQLEVLKSIDSSGTRSVVYTCSIYDKNFNLVALQNGSVKLDGYAMNLRANVLGGEQYYLQGESEVAFAPATTYTFTLTLSDGSKYYGSVISQTADLTRFNVPSSQSRTQNINVTWAGTDPNAKMSIDMIYKYKSDTTSGMSSQTISIPNPSGGAFTINSSLFNSSQGTTYEVDLTLVSEVRGTIDSHFRAGSSTVCDLSIDRVVRLTN